MQPVYKFLSVSALALAISMPVAAQQVIDTHANAAVTHQNPHAPIQAQHPTAPVPQPHVQVQTSAQAPTIPPAAPNVAPVFRDPQMAVMMEPTEKHIDPLDYKNPANLNRQRGAIVDMAVGNQPAAPMNVTPPASPTAPQAELAGPPVTATESRANLAIPTPNNPVGTPDNAMTAPIMQPHANVTTAPTQPQQPAGIIVRSTDPQTQNTHVTVTTPQALVHGGTTTNVTPTKTPSSQASNTSTVTIQMPTEQVGTLTSNAPQQVNRSMVIIGNSDTGVDLNALK